MRRRRNLLDTARERWRPPLLTGTGTRVEEALAALRRFFDLQGGSIWRDLRGELPSLQGRLLDVGCGAQPYRKLVPAAVDYVGIDIMDSETRFGYTQKDTIYYSGPLWPLPGETADCVLCTETLEHVLEPKAFLSEAFRCLKPGGSLLATVPFAARWHFIPYDYWRYTPSSLKHLLSEAGFADIVVYGRGNALTVACYKVMALILAAARPVSSRFFVKAVSLTAAFLCLPLLVALAVVANLSLRCDSGEDCLGYTVKARRPATPA